MNVTIRRCDYIKTDGRRCGCPALRTRRYCYFHYEVNRAVAHLDVPPLEDGNAVQLALTDLARAVADDRIPLKNAALLAYILQTASSNLKRVQLGVFKDQMVRDLPDLDPYSRGLAPQPGERNRDPERAAHPGPAPSAPFAKTSALSKFQAPDPRPGASPPSVVDEEPIARKIDAAKAGSVKHTRALLGMRKGAG